MADGLSARPSQHHIRPQEYKTRRDGYLSKAIQAF
jgi:hypothetical protein